MSNDQFDIERSEAICQAATEFMQQEYEENATAAIAFGLCEHLRRVTTVLSQALARIREMEIVAEAVRLEYTPVIAEWTFRAIGTTGLRYVTYSDTGSVALIYSQDRSPLYYAIAEHAHENGGEDEQG